MKTAEELNAIKEDVETLNNKLNELTDEELAKVTGGHDLDPLQVKDYAKVLKMLEQAFKQGLEVLKQQSENHDSTIE
ncbi:MAG: bacteriocin [Prevotellaceae bacterium]|nr:bacteriocin [Candidatus Faecinaster equi]